MSDFEIEKTLVASTFHVSYEDMTFLKSIVDYDQYSLSYPFWITEYEYGVSVKLLSDFDLAKIGDMNFSDGFLELIIFCVSLDCNCLKLDCDGPIYEGFKKYDW